MLILLDFVAHSKNTFWNLAADHNCADNLELCQKYISKLNFIFCVFGGCLKGVLLEFWIRIAWSAMFCGCHCGCDLHNLNLEHRRAYNWVWEGAGDVCKPERADCVKSVRLHYLLEICTPPVNKDSIAFQGPGQWQRLVCRKGIRVREIKHGQEWLGPGWGCDWLRG
jgi:hypothetical protein